MALTTLVNDLYQGQLPKPSHRKVLRDRSTYVDYSKIDLEPLVKARAEEVLSQGMGVPPELLWHDLQFINAMVDRIQDRGGRVIFVRLPTTGFVHAVEEANFPREKYWNMLAATTKASTINFADYRELSGYTCPEGSHLDSKDSPVFTRALARIIQAKVPGRF